MTVDPHVRQRAAGVVSFSLGATGAPYDDVCPTECDHEACTVVRDLIEAGLLKENGS